MERICLNGRQVPGFALGDCDDSFWLPWKTYPTEGELAAGDQTMTTLVEALDVTIGGCSAIPDVEKQLWKSTIYAKYQKLHSDVADYVSGKTKMVTVPIPTDTSNAIIRGNLKCRLDELRRDYESMRARVVSYCGEKGVPPVAPVLPGPSPSSDGGSGEKKEDWLGTVKTVAGVVAVVVTVAGGVYLVYKATSYLPAPKSRGSRE
jgi:hypothetical protein